jgi:hypothetical protein
MSRLVGLHVPIVRPAPACRQSRSPARARDQPELVKGKAVAAPKSPSHQSDGLHHTLLPDGRVRFTLTRQGSAVSHLMLSPSHAGEIAANALGAAVDAFDRGPPIDEPKRSTAPFVRITGLGVGNCSIEDHVCIVIKAGAAEIGFALPKKKLTEFAQWVAANETLMSEQLK